MNRSDEFGVAGISVKKSSSVDGSRIALPFAPGWTWPHRKSSAPRANGRTRTVQCPSTAGSGPISFKSGLRRFEGMFSELGVGGAVPEDVRKLVWELGRARNVILHRGGVVDAQFASVCPWTGMVPGQQLFVTRDRCLEYVLATTHYLNIIRTRLSLAFDPNGSTPVEADSPASHAGEAVAGHDQVVEDLDVEQARGERGASDAFLPSGPEPTTRLRQRWIADRLPVKGGAA